MAAGIGSPYVTEVAPGRQTALNEWDKRAAYYRQSRSHATGDDLDQLVAWCEPGEGVTALDVASGGGHVARRLRALGCLVTTADAAAGMEPDVVCPAEALPLDDASFDVVACRLGLHHFDDPGRAIGEMARVARRLVVLEDTLWIDERVQQAESAARPDARRATTRPSEMLGMLRATGLRVSPRTTFEKRHDMDDWLSATGCGGETAARVRDLLAHVSEPGGAAWSDTKLVVKAVR